MNSIPSLPSATPPLPSAICHLPSGIEADLILAKYIIVERDGAEFPILFHRDLQHSDVLSTKAGRPVSAGFYQLISSSLILVGGASTSLNLSARLQDAALIKHYLLLPS